MLRLTLGVLTEALLGFLDQHLIGCRTGSFPLTSNSFVSTLYGALVGLLAARPQRLRRDGWHMTAMALGSPTDSTRGGQPCWTSASAF